MAITFIAAASGSNGSATCNKPASTADGDIMIAAIAQGNRTTAPTLAGWNEIVFAPDNSTNVAVTLMYKVASSEGASYSFTVSSVRKVGIFTFRGQSPSNPVLGSNGNFTGGGNSTTITPGSVNINEDDAVSILAAAHSATGVTWSFPGGWAANEGWDGFGGAAAYQIFTSAPGATDPTITTDTSGQVTAAQAVIRVPQARVPRLALLGVG